MLEQLSRFPLLEELSPAGRSRLLAAARHVTLQPNTQVLQRGDEVAGAYLVERGALRVYYISAEGREGTLYWIDPHARDCVLALAGCVGAAERIELLHVLGRGVGRQGRGALELAEGVERLCFLRHS